MKIVVTVATYGPLFDGVQNITQNHVEMLQKKGFEIIVVTQKQRGLLDFEIINGVKVYRVNIFTKLGIHFGKINEYRKLICKLCDNDTLLINVCTQSATTDTLFRILKNLPCKKILYLHGKFEKDKYIKNIILRIWYDIRGSIYYKFSSKFKPYDAIINIHELDSATIYFRNKKIKNLYIVNNFVEDIFFEDNNKEKSNYIISVSNYSTLKNQEQVLRAFYMSNIDKNISLIFIGSKNNKYLEYLKKLDTNLKIKHGNRDVKFLTDLSRCEIKNYLSNALLFLLGSKIEKVPVVILESMASGIPYISTNVGSVKYYPGGFTVQNICEMIYWIEKLLKENYIRNQMGNIGREFANYNLNKKRANDELEKIINDVMGEEKE